MIQNLSIDHVVTYLRQHDAPWYNQWSHIPSKQEGGTVEDLFARYRTHFTPAAYISGPENDPGLVWRQFCDLDIPLYRHDASVELSMLKKEMAAMQQEHATKLQAHIDQLAQCRAELEEVCGTLSSFRKVLEKQL